jgi:hypothetical protein
MLSVASAGASEGFRLPAAVELHALFPRVVGRAEHNCTPLFASHGNLHVVNLVSPAPTGLPLLSQAACSICLQASCHATFPLEFRQSATITKRTLSCSAELESHGQLS